MAGFLSCLKEVFFWYLQLSFARGYCDKSIFAISIFFADKSHFHSVIRYLTPRAICSSCRFYDRLWTL